MLTIEVDSVPVDVEEFCPHCALARRHDTEWAEVVRVVIGGKVRIIERLPFDAYICGEEIPEPVF